jgi:hypothetical protein
MKKPAEAGFGVAVLALQAAGLLPLPGHRGDAEAHADVFGHGFLVDGFLSLTPGVRLFQEVELGLPGRQNFDDWDIPRIARRPAQVAGG